VCPAAAAAAEAVVEFLRNNSKLRAGVPPELGVKTPMPDFATFPILPIRNLLSEHDFL